MLTPSGADVHGGLWHQYKEKAWEEAELESADGFGLNLDAGRESRVAGHSGKKDACLLGLGARPQWGGSVSKAEGYRMSTAMSG